MADIKLDVAFWNYDRTSALAEGKVLILRHVSEVPECCGLPITWPQTKERNTRWTTRQRNYL
jgi:hypothetical protein